MKRVLGIGLPGQTFLSSLALTEWQPMLAADLEALCGLSPQAMTICPVLSYKQDEASTGFPQQAACLPLVLCKICQAAACCRDFVRGRKSWDRGPMLRVSLAAALPGRSSRPLSCELDQICNHEQRGRSIFRTGRVTSSP